MSTFPDKVDPFSLSRTHARARTHTHTHTRDHYIEMQAARCIQQWWRYEVVGYHLDPARALAKKVHT